MYILILCVVVLTCDEHGNGECLSEAARCGYENLLTQGIPSVKVEEGLMGSCEGAWSDDNDQERERVCVCVDLNE